MLKLYCLVFFLFFTSQIYSQWIQTSGPAGGHVDCLAVGSDGKGSVNIFAGTGNGVYISTDNGGKWTHRNSGLPEYYIYSLAISGTSIFAGTYGDYAVYRSTNNGKSWNPASAGLPQYYSVNAFAVCDTNIFAAIYDGVYLSTNNGVSWTKASSGLPENSYVWDMAVSGKSIFATIIDYGTYRSTDYGKSWSAADSGLPENINVYAFAAGRTNIFAGVSKKGVFLSTDNGISWNPVNSGLPKDSLGQIYVQSLAVSGTNVFAACADGFFLSSDNGTNWMRISQSLPGPDYISDLAIIGTNIVAASGEGIYRSTDNGVNWAAANSGFINSDINTLAVNGTNVFAGGSQSGQIGGIYLSTDNGESWTIDSLGCPGIPVINAFAISGTNTFAGGYCTVQGELFSSRIFLSVHNGKNWTDISSGLPEAHTVEALAVSGRNLIAAILSWNESDSIDVFISADNGKNWIKQGPKLPLINDLTILGSNIFAATKKGVYVSTDTCKNWTIVSSGLPKGENEEILALAVCDSYLFAAAKWERVYISTDNGANWYPVRAYLPSTCFAVKEKNIFAGGGNRIFLTDDYCRTSLEMSAGLSKDIMYFQINALALNETDIFAATNAGVWRRSLSDMITSAERHSPDIPAQFHLEQNYPNPFNTNTVIKYSMPQEGFVTLKIFDILGKEIFTLVKEEQSAGAYTVKFDGSNLAGGIYMYQLRAGNLSAAKKFVLIK